MPGFPGFFYGKPLRRNHMATKATMQEDDTNYAAAFDEAPAAQPEATEDEAFGLNLPSESEELPSGDSGTGTAPSETIDLTGAPGEPAAPTEPTEPAAPVSDDLTDPGEAAEGKGDDIEAKRQKIRSWEGRLKALKAEIGEGDEAPGEAPGEALDAAAGEAPGEAAADAPDDLTRIKAQLEDDFGADFVNAICAIAKAAAGDVAAEQVGGVSQTVQDLIDNLKDERSQAFYQSIVDAHPDFQEIADSPQFAQWVSSTTPDEQASLNRIIQSGTAKEINAMLTRYKSEGQGGDDPGAAGGGVPDSDMESLDDAEGVRSSGLRLPNAPTPASDDYEKAWAES
jgi:hypothetical protein